MQDKINRLKEISEELFDIANSLAGDETGTEASCLHLTRGNIDDVIQSLNKEERFNPGEIRDRFQKWRMDLLLLQSFH